MAAPRIPVVELGGGRPPTGDGARAALVNPVSQMEAQNRAKGIGTGSMEGAAKLAFALAGELKKQDVDRDQIEAVKLEGRVLASIDDEKSKLDPLDPNYTEQIKEIINRHTTGSMADARFRTREVRDDTSRRLARIGAAAELVAATDRRKSLGDEAERVYKERLDTLYGQIRKDPDASDTYTAAFQADAARLRTGINPDRLRALSHVAADGMLAAKVEGYAMGAPGRPANFASARKFLTDNSGSFTPETARALNGQINALESKARSDYALSSTDAAARVRIEIIKQSQDPAAAPTVTRERLDALVKSGGIRPQEADSLYATLAVAERARSTVIDRNRAALTNFEAGTHTPQDTDLVFRMAMDRAADRRGSDKTKLDAFDSPEALEALDLVASRGIVPPMVAQQIENLANAGGPGSGEMGVTNLAKAAAVYKMLRERYPNVAGLKNNDRLNLIIEQTKANGGDVAQAARDVLKSLPDDKMDAERITAARKAATDTNWANEGRVVLGDWFDRQLNTAGSLLRTGARLTTGGQIADVMDPGGSFPRISRGRATADLPQDMLSELKINFERHFRLSPNKDSAMKAAVEQVKREWSVTYVAGDKTPYVMKHAPASFLPPERDWLRGDIDGIMSAATTKLLKSSGWAPPSDAISGGRPVFILEADHRTHSEAARKEAPSFVIKTLREDRLYHISGRVRMPTEEELKTMPVYRDRLGDLDVVKAAREARDKMERAAKDRADRRRKQ